MEKAKGGREKGGRRQKAEGKRRKAKGGRRKAEGRRQKEKSRRQRAEKATPRAGEESGRHTGSTGRRAAHHAESGHTVIRETCMTTHRHGQSVRETESVADRAEAVPEPLRQLCGAERGHGYVCAEGPERDGLHKQVAQELRGSR